MLPMWTIFILCVMGHCSFCDYCPGKITEEGVFLEQLETDVSKYLPEVTDADVSGDAVDININLPMTELRTLLSQYPVTTRLNLSGTLVVARDQAHAKILERVDSGEGEFGNLDCSVTPSL